MSTGGPGDGAREARERAALLVSAGRPREAIPLLERALAAAPDDAAALCQLSLAHLHLGDRARQLEVAERAVAADPEGEWAHRLRCDALGALGRRSEAVEAARRAVALAPREPLALLCLVNALRATAHHWEEASARAEDLVALAPARGSAHEARALVALGRGRLAEAEAGMRRALALEPETASFHNNLGLALLRQGRREEAVAAFERAAQIDPALEVAQRNLSIGLRHHLHRGLGGLLADGVMRFIPGRGRPELTRARRIAAAVVVVVLFGGGFAALRRVPGSFPPVFLLLLTVTAFVAPRIRLRRLPPGLQRFAMSRRLAWPLVVWRGAVVALLATALAALLLLLAALPDPHVGPRGVAVRALALSGVAAANVIVWRAMRRRRGRAR